MANSGLQLLGFVLALLGWVALIAATILPQWRMSSYAGDNIITSVAVYQGLWMSCAWQSTGQIQCKAYDSILNLSSALQATRALMVVSIVMGIIGIGVASMGMKCTRCGGDNKVQKARIAMTGGLIFVVGGMNLDRRSSSAGLGLPWCCWAGVSCPAPALGNQGTASSTPRAKPLPGPPPARNMSSALIGCKLSSPYPFLPSISRHLRRG
uniref:Claudin n=1 Tax=Gopherus evgoodei TaxID=1825980 RepID=A0A8C4WIH2_9SAUR